MTIEDIENKSKAEREYLASNPSTPLWILDILRKDGEYYVRDFVRTNPKWIILRDIEYGVGYRKHYLQALAMSKYLEII